MISYHFPPMGGAGVQRTTKFVKNLPAMGWTPIVLTVNNPLYSMYDETLCAEIPQYVEIIKSDEWLPNQQFSVLRTRLRRENSQIDNQNIHPHAQRMSFKQSVRYLFRELSRLIIPDIHIAWIVSAVLKGLQICRYCKPDIIYATAPPHSTLLSAYLISKLTDIPYVVDFRDAWTLYPDRIGTKKAKIEGMLERQIIASANQVIYATNTMKDDYEHALPERKHKFCLINNGYDESDFVNLDPLSLPSISIVYMGRVSPERKLNYFLLALKKIAAKRKDAHFKVKIYFVGEVYINHHMYIKQLGLDDMVEFVGYLPHREALSYALGADLLLLLGSGDPAEMTGKIFEYLRTCRPIFAVVPQAGMAAAVIRQTGHGIVAQYDNVEEIAAKLDVVLDRDYLQQWHASMRIDNNVLQYERVHQARMLAQILDSVVHE